MRPAARPPARPPAYTLCQAVALVCHEEMNETSPGAAVLGSPAELPPCSAAQPPACGPSRPCCPCTAAGTVPPFEICVAYSALPWSSCVTQPDGEKVIDLQNGLEVSVLDQILTKSLK